MIIRLLLEATTLPLPDGGKPRRRWRSDVAVPRPGSIDLGRCGTYKPRDRGPLERSRCFPPSIGPARRRPLEAHLPTIEARPQAAPRLSRAHGDGRRPEGARTAPSQGAQASVGLGRQRLPVTAIGRLKTRAEFLHVKGGARFAAPSLVLQARRRAADTGASPELARFGFTATKSLGGAVLRNRARRRLKEAVRLAGPRHAVEGYDYVLIARAGTVQRRFTELVKDLERALAKVHEPSPAKKR